MNIKEKLAFLIRETVLELVKGDFIKIKAKLIEGLTIDDIKEELKHWGTLTSPPAAAYQNINYMEYHDGLGYAMEFELWIENQGSDLTLSCEAIMDESENISFTILNLHVL